MITHGDQFSTYLPGSRGGPNVEPDRAASKHVAREWAGVDSRGVDSHGEGALGHARRLRRPRALLAAAAVPKASAQHPAAVHQVQRKCQEHQTCAGVSSFDAYSDLKQQENPRN